MKLIRYGLFLILFFCAHQSVIAQIEKTITRKFGNSEGITGIETIDIETNLRDTTRNGNYKLRTFQHKMDQSIVEQSRISGKYNRGHKDKRWTYALERYQIRVDSLKQLKSFIKHFGTRTEMVQKFELGAPDSIWTIQQDSIQADTLFQVNFTHKIDWILRNYQYEDKSTGRLQSIKGYFDKDFFKDSIWILTYQSEGLRFEETRHYKHGFMTGYSLKELSTGFVVDEETYEEVILKLEPLFMLDTNIYVKHETSVFPIGQNRPPSLFTSPDMSFKPGDKLIVNALDAIFNPFIPGKNKHALTISIPFKARMFKNTFSDAQKDSITTLSEQKIPYLLSQIKRFREDKVLVHHYSQISDIQVLAEKHQLLEKALFETEKRLQYLQSDDYAFKSIRTELASINWSQLDGEDLLLKHAGYFNKETKSNFGSEIKKAANWLSQIEFALSASAVKVDQIKQQISDMEKLGTILIQINNRKQEQQAAAWRGEFVQGNPGVTKPISSQRVNDYFLEQFVDMQQNEMFDAINKEEAIEKQRNMAFMVRNFQDDLDRVKNSLLRLQKLLGSLPSKFENDKGKAVYPTLFINGTNVINEGINATLDMTNLNAFSSEVHALINLVQKLEVIAGSDKKLVKDLEKRMKKSQNIEETKGMILGF